MDERIFYNLEQAVENFQGRSGSARQEKKVGRNLKGECVATS